MVKRILKSNSSKAHYGVMGTATRRQDIEGDNLYVGDLAVAKFKNATEPFRGLIVEIEGRFGIMGAVSRDLNSFEYVLKVLPNEVIDRFVVKELGLIIEEPKKMTLEEIEEKLGYLIEIVEED